MTNSTDHEGLRLRRTQSVTRAEEIQAVEQKVRKSQPDKPYVLQFFICIVTSFLFSLLTKETMKIDTTFAFLRREYVALLVSVT